MPGFPYHFNFRRAPAVSDPPATCACTVLPLTNGERHVEVCGACSERVVAAAEIITATASQ